jgi:hypothetical protein
MFDRNGHLTDRALAALVSGEDLPELTRLEMAEHLAYCDFCLQRYTDALIPETLLPPPQSCKTTLLRQIRAKTIRLVTSRYATAAAAVVLALTLLWSDVSIPIKTVSAPVTFLSESMSEWTERWSNTLYTLMEGTQNIFNGLTRPEFGGKINERT